MEKQKHIQLHQTLIAEETELGEGLCLPLENLSPPIIQLLRRSYKENPDCMSGDIEFLFQFDGKGVSIDDYWY